MKPVLVKCHRGSAAKVIQAGVRASGNWRRIGAAGALKGCYTDGTTFYRFGKGSVLEFHAAKAPPAPAVVAPTMPPPAAPAAVRDKELHARVEATHSLVGKLLDVTNRTRASVEHMATAFAQGRHAYESEYERNVYNALTAIRLDVKTLREEILRLPPEGDYGRLPT